MWGLNWIDLIVVLVLLLAAYRGIKAGVATQLLVVAGFFITLFAAGWLLPRLLPFSDPTLKTMLNATLVLFAASVVAYLCLRVGDKLRWSFQGGKLSQRTRLLKVEHALGFVPGLIGGLALVWLLGTAVSRLPFAGFSNSVRDSMILRQLTSVLPPVPMVFATFNHQIDPNSQPALLVQPKQNKDFAYDPGEVRLAAEKAEASIVRITSFGCGGLVTGSGFVIGKELVASNAHVIAGVERPIIKHQGSSYEGVPVLFDPGLDVTILRVKGLQAPVLPLATTPIADDTTVAVIGYPGGNYQVAPGIIRENVTVFGRTIYDISKVGRDVYGIQATTEQGISGGPAVLADGRVAGIMFSKTDKYPDYAYAIAPSYVVKELAQAQTSFRPVSTGACAAD